MKKVTLLLLVLALLFTNIKAQMPNFTWAKQIGGIANDNPWIMTVDASGSVYTTGYFQGTVDFDPGPGIYSLTSVGGSWDIFVSKLDASGNFSWAQQFGGASNNQGRSIAVDPFGNIYTTGAFVGTVDFDPGVGIHNLISSGGSDIFVSKLDASGNFVWAKQMGGLSSEDGFSIAVDIFGNLFTGGRFTGTADFDPGAGIYNLASTGSSDIFISKLDTSGNFIWAKQMGGATTDIARSIDVDVSGNVYAIGAFNDTADFDPGLGIYTLIPVFNDDIFVLKLDSSGNFVWAKQMGGMYFDSGISIAVDVPGNIYTTGYFGGTGDFDPGIGTYNLTTMGSDDIFVSKLDSVGNFAWAKNMGGSSSDVGWSIDVDLLGRVYTTGAFNLTADLDPGVGTYNLISAGGTDIFVSCLDMGGNFVWAEQMGGPDNEIGYSVDVDILGNIYAAGHFGLTADFDPGPGTYNLSSAGGMDIFVSKFCTSVLPPSIISGSDSICAGSSQIYSVVNDTSVTFYSWSLPGGWTGTSNTNTIHVIANGTSGTISVMANNACGISTSQNLNVIVSSLPTVSFNYLGPDTFCISYQSQILSGGIPAGGVYSGTGVTGTNFDPGTAGIGNHVITYSFTNGNNCTNTDSIVFLVTGCFGIDNNQDPYIGVYPNPFTNTFSINGVDKGILTLYNVIGEVVYKKTIVKNNDTIDSEILLPGIYFLEIAINDQKQLIKLIKHSN
jgi:hypothetical protein